MVDSSWYVRNDVKEELEIASGDTADDAILDSWGARVDRYIDNEIAPHITTLPVTSSLSAVLKDAAIAAVAAKYRRKNKEFDTANTYHEEFTKLIDSAIKRLRRDNETQSQRPTVTRPYATEPLASD